MHHKSQIELHFRGILAIFISISTEPKNSAGFQQIPIFSMCWIQRQKRLTPFYDADTDILTRILVDTSDTHDFLKLFVWQAGRHADILATILARMSARMSVSWNAGLIVNTQERKLLKGSVANRWTEIPKPYFTRDGSNKSTYARALNRSICMLYNCLEWYKWVLTNLYHDRQLYNTLIPLSHESPAVGLQTCTCISRLSGSVS